MGLFARKACVALSWDAEGRACGVRLALKGGKTSVCATATAGAAPGAFKDNLEKVWRELDPDGELFAVAGGAIPGEVIFEMRTPKLSGDDLVNAIDFELPRQVPCPVEDMVWGFRAIGAIEGTHEISVRIWAVPKKAWEKLLDDVSASPVKLDLICSPLMSDAADGAERFAFMPSIDPLCGLGEGGDGLKAMLPSLDPACDATAFGKALAQRLDWTPETSEASVRFAPCLALGSYALGGAYAQGQRLYPEMPSEVEPKRFKALKIACLAILCLNALLGLALGGRELADRYERFNSVREEKVAILSRIARIKAENAQNREIDQTIKRIGESGIGNQELLQCLHFLSVALPERVWLADLSGGAERMDLTIKADGDWEADAVKWDSAKLLSPESVRKRRNADGSAEIFLKLACKGGGLAFAEKGEGGAAK